MGQPHPRPGPAPRSEDAPPSGEDGRSSAEAAPPNVEDGRSSAEDGRSSGEDGRSSVAAARSLLFVPGDRADRFEKAASAGADAVICDLEDAVHPAAKETARAEVVRWLSAGGSACVRVNAVDTRWYVEDRAALAGLPGLRAVVVPKAQDPAALAALRTVLGPDTPIVALIETALGLHRAYEIAVLDGVVRLAFGAIDFALDIGAATDDGALRYARCALVVAARAAGAAPPVDGVTVDLADPAATRADATRARRLGFGGKLCVHPRQVGEVNAGFTPTEEEVRQARRVVAAATGGGTARLDGQMIDRPVVERAHLVLRQAGLGSTPVTARQRRS